MRNQVTPQLIMHATAGGIMLIAGMTAILARKGGNYHRVSGKIYFYATLLTGITGFIISFQTSNLFLLGTSVFVVYMVSTAYRSLYLKHLDKVKKAAPIDRMLLVFAVGASVFLLAYGGFGLYKGNINALAPLLFGVLSARFTYRDIKKFVKGPDDKKHWLYNHIYGMLGSYIAGITAFLAVNAGFVVHTFLLPIWLGPTIIGVPLIIYWQRKYQSKPADLSNELSLKINIPA